MTQQTGRVGWVGSKKLSGRMYYSFNLIGVKDMFFRTGTVDTGLVKGDQVSFEYSEDNYGLQVDVKTVVKDSAPSATQNAPPVAGVATKDNYWEKKGQDDKIRQHIISYQAATNTAIKVVETAIQLDILPKPTGSKIADKFDSLVALIEQVADDLVLKFENAPEHIKELKAMTQVAEEATNVEGDLSDD